MRKSQVVCQITFQMSSILMAVALVVIALNLHHISTSGKSNARFKPPPDAALPNSKYVLFNKGDDLLNNGNYTQAIPYFDKALAVDPTNKITLNNIGVALTSLGNYTQAIPYLDKALAIDPTDTQASDLKKLAQASIHKSTASQAH